MLLETFCYTVASIFIGCFSYNQDSVLDCFSFNYVQEVKNADQWKQLRVNGPNGEFLSAKKGTFRKFSKLSVLRMRGVAKLEPGFLDGADELRVIEMIDSKLDEIKPYTFANKDLSQVSITVSHLKEVHPHAFHNTTKLRSAAFAETNIHTIRSGVFSNTEIVNLNLNSNNIYHIEEGAFFGMKNLTNLFLFNNKLKYFPSKKLFGQNVDLRTLRLDGNQFTELNQDMFSSISSLKFLCVSGNYLTSIGQGTFANVKGLEGLDLSGNSLKELKADVFPVTTVMRELYLHDNLFSYLELEVLNKLPMLTDITLDNNPWQCNCVKQIEEWACTMGQHHVTKFCDRHAKSPIDCISLPEDDSKCHYELDKSQYTLKEYKKKVTN